MQLGMVGLGRMGSNLSRRLMQAGHEIVAFDVDPDSVRQLEDEGAIAATSLQDLVGKLESPRAVWIMVPAAHAGSTADQLHDLMLSGDIVIDGGNSYYRDDIDRSDRYSAKGVRYVDVGTSGGVFGLDRGFCLMIGGDEETVRHLDPIFRALAPGRESAERTPGRDDDSATTAEEGYLHCGPAGAGHFVKMVHNGIEYGLMAAYAEGLNVLQHANAGSEHRAPDAETAPLRDARYYRYDIDVADVAEVWRRGSVVSSWLLDLTAAALHQDPELADFSGHVSDSGEGRWTVLAAIDEAVPVHVLSAALYDRFESRGEAEFANKVLSAMRSRFGGHAEQHP